MKINVGESWRTRHGELITIIRNDVAGNHPIMGVDRRKVIYTFTDKGTYGSGEWHHFDLIEKV